MPSGLVLITGGSGHIGFKTIVVALESGYSVRAVVRSQSKADGILNTPSIKRIKPGDRLTFAIVPDFLVPGAFDEAIKGVDYAIHLASPITGGKTDWENEFIKPALQGTLGFLESAKAHSPTIKRIVITSSIVAIMSWVHISSEVAPTVTTEHTRIPDPQAPYANEFEGYSASKAITLNATEKWMATHAPRFSIAHIHPGYTVGRDELVTDVDDFLRGTNKVVLLPALGEHLGPLSSAVVHLDDIADAHVAALDAGRIPDGTSLVLTAGGTDGNDYGDIAGIVARRFPRAVQSGVLPNNGSAVTHRTRFDKTETLRLLGWDQFRSFEDAVVDVVGHYLELKGVEAA